MKRVLTNRKARNFASLVAFVLTVASPAKPWAD